MDFNKKLQDLRKRKGLTQEELAKALFVSRTAVSKWESGRGYPNLESLKDISKFFSVTVDELLSGEELLTIARQDNKQKEKHFRDLVFGLLDVCTAALLFLPFFAQKAEGVIQEVPLLALTGVRPWLLTLFFVAVTFMILVGVLTLALQNVTHAFWTRYKNGLSMLANAIVVFLFIISRQPYAAAFMFIFLIIKVLLCIKKQ